MDEPITYPTWSDVNIPQSLIHDVRRLGTGIILDYLILNRIYRFQIKAQYVYTCQSCGYQKRISRNYESYLQCEQCRSGLISSLANWRMGKDRIEGWSRKTNDGLLRKTIRQMSANYTHYFRDYPPEDFLKCDWVMKKPSFDIPENGVAWGQNSPDLMDLPSEMPSFAAKFCCGEQVVGGNQQICIYKAAVLCPFLWDDCFDWKYLSPKDSGRETHIFPVLNLWCKLKGDRKSKKSAWASSSEGFQFADEEEVPMYNPPQPLHAPDQQNEAPAPVEAAPVGPNSVPAAVLEALADDPDILNEMFQ